MLMMLGVASGKKKAQLMRCLGKRWPSDAHDASRAALGKKRRPS